MRIEDEYHSSGMSSFSGLEKSCFREKAVGGQRVIDRRDREGGRTHHLEVSSSFPSLKLSLECWERKDSQDALQH